MDLSLVGMWGKSGLIAKGVVVILLLMLIFVVAIAIERLIVFLKAKNQSRAYALILQELLKNKKYKEAADAATQFKFSHIAKVIRAGLIEFMKGKLIGQTEADGSVCAPGYDVLGAVNRAIEKTGARETASFRRGLAGLATVGSTAPFVGLFGTVVGIINSFSMMASGGAAKTLDVVGPGIAEALITTAVGIAVAVIGVMLYNYFSAKVDALQVETNESSLEILDVLVKQHEATSPSKKAA